MFRRKSKTKGAKGRGNAKAKKAVKRLLEKPSTERMAAIADMAARENQQQFGVSGGSVRSGLTPNPIHSLSLTLKLAALFSGHDPARGSNWEVFIPSRVESGWVRGCWNISLVGSRPVMRFSSLNGLGRVALARSGPREVI